MTTCVFQMKPGIDCGFVASGTPTRLGQVAAVPTPIHLYQ